METGRHLGGSRMRFAKLVLTLILSFPASIVAQQVRDLQTRPVGHVQYDFSKSAREGFFWSRMGYR